MGWIVVVLGSISCTGIRSSSGNGVLVHVGNNYSTHNLARGDSCRAPIDVVVLEIGAQFWRAGLCLPSQ